MITLFHGPNRFLSNFAAVNVVLDGITYPSVEHAYQAAKTKNLNHRAKVAIADRASRAKFLGSKKGMAVCGVTLRDDWNQVKYSVMLDLNRQKYSQPEYRDKLLATGTQKLIEGNYWHDNYWGDCVCNKCSNVAGKNQLGLILMTIREEIRK